MKSMLAKYGTGYYTVEATFIVTICVVILMAILYTGLYVHDRIIVETVANRQTSCWIHQDEDEKWSEDGFVGELKKDLAGKLFLFSVNHVGVDETLIIKTVNIRYGIPVSLGFLRRIWGGTDGSREESISVSEVRPAKWKWDADAVKGEKNDKGTVD